MICHYPSINRKALSGRKRTPDCDEERFRGTYYTASAISSRIALAASARFGACVIGRPTTR